MLWSLFSVALAVIPWTAERLPDADIHSDACRTDGFVLVGAPHYDAPSTTHPRGRARLYSAQGALVRQWVGPVNATLGLSVGSAGDLDGDGVIDHLIGVPRQSQVRAYSGRTGALLHTAGGPRWFGTVTRGLGDIDLDGRDDVLIGDGDSNRGAVWVYTDLGSSHDFTREVHGLDYGRAATGLGDIDGDGHPDYATSAYTHGCSAGTDCGRVWVRSGADHSLMWSGWGTQRDAEWGRALSSAGDVNGDGYPDLIIGEPRYDGSQSQSGRATVISGRYIAEVYAGIPTTGPRDLHVLWGNTYVGWLGAAVSGIGDINGDGLDDLLVGVPNSNYATVYAGGSGAVMRTHSSSAGDRTGFSVSGVGDLNCDGVPDYAIGSPRHSGSRGKITVYSGASGTVLWTAVGTDPNELLGFSVAGPDPLLGSWGTTLP